MKIGYNRSANNVGLSFHSKVFLNFNAIHTNTIINNNQIFYFSIIFQGNTNYDVFQRSFGDDNPIKALILFLLYSVSEYFIVYSERYHCYACAKDRLNRVT